jgi:serine/threonine-protein kinase
MSTGSQQVDRVSAATDGLGGDDLPRALGRYILLKKMARGGMGEVFLASTTGLEGAERPVVVKIIRREHAKDPSFIARFLDEARVQAQLQHSGVAQVLDAAIEERTGEPYAVVEYVEGRSLGDVRSRAVQVGQSIAWADAVAVGTLIAEALAHVHERQDPSGKGLAIVHRDLSPQNVMMSFTGDAKIIDFGTARGLNRRCHTVAGVVFAKPGYVAPEVANGDSGDGRVDLYALGVMLWELCAGRRFLQGDANVHMSAVARNAKDLPPIAEITGAPPELDVILAKLTSFDRDARYSSGSAAARDLARILAAAPPLANGERGVRARAAELVKSLFPGEPARSRHEFARLVTAARDIRGQLVTPQKNVNAKATPAGEEDLLPGTRYRLLREIGRGGSSVVYEAEHQDLGRKVALKVLDREPSASEELSARFRREARALSRLSHEGLLAVHDFGKADDGRLFAASELLEGETLEAFLAREKGLDWREALGLVGKALDGLAVAHEAGVIHRDLKPANLFMVDGGGLKILDFGLAKSRDDLNLKGTFATERAGFTLFGTPEYMAPEQAASGQVDARADLYALGCVLYEMLTGRLPFVGEGSVAILDAKIKGSPEHPRERAPARGIPAHVDELVMRALARHPSVRFQTAVEMRQAIEIALDAPMKKRAGRRTLGFVALAATMAFAAVVLVGKVKQIRAAVPFLHAQQRTEMVAVANTPAVATPVAASNPAPAALAAVAPAADPATGPEEDSDDGDFVDDTVPAPSLAAAPAAPSETSVAPEIAPPAKTKSHKHAATPKKVAAANTNTNANANAKAVEPIAKLPASAAVAVADAEPASKAKAAAPKGHHKHKGRVASKPQ